MDDTDRRFVNPKRGGVGVVVTVPDGEVLKYRVQLKFLATNNEAEYEGILTGLRIGKALRAKNLFIQSDSKLIIGQIKEEYEAKEERMQKYLRLMRRLTQEFNRVEFTQIPRSQNMVADEVTKMASSEEGSTRSQLDMEVQKRPSIEEVATFAIRAQIAGLRRSYPSSKTDTSYRMSRKPRRLGRE